MLRTRFGVVPYAEGKAFREEQHPRDARGRFIRLGSAVRTAGGETGEVTGVRGSQVQVRTEGGDTVTVDRRKLTVTAGPARKPRAGTRRPPRPARSARAGKPDKPAQPRKVTQADFAPEGEKTQYEVMDGTAKRVAAAWDVDDKDLQELLQEEGRADAFATMTPEERRVAFVRSQLYSWAGSSGGPVQVAGIAAVLDDLGLPYELTDFEKRTTDYIRGRPAMRRAAESLGRTIYQTTQAWFAERGVTEVEALRASRGVEWDEKRPFTSWTLHAGGLRRDGDRVIRKETIPVERILSVPPTGFGTLDEAELIVLPVKAKRPARTRAGR